MEKAEITSACVSGFTRVQTTATSSEFATMVKLLPASLASGSDLEVFMVNTVSGESQMSQFCYVSLFVLA